MVLPKCLKLNMLRYRLARATLRMEAGQAFSFSLRRAEGCLQAGKQQRQHSEVGGGRALYQGAHVLSASHNRGRKDGGK